MNWAYSKKTNHFAAALLSIPAVLSACTQLSTLNTSTPSIATAKSFVPTGTMAAKIFFSNSSDNASGSFDSSSISAASSGTSLTQATSATVFHLGLQPTRVFNPDGTLLGSQQYNTDGSVNTASINHWPAWLQSVDIGISGPNNPNATSIACANFAGSTTNDLGAICNLGSSQVPCGASKGQFRVSEADCTSNTQTGIGGPNDGVYLRAVFNRGSTGLGPTENILVVIEYVASSLNPAPISANKCFSESGLFSPESCSDFVWRAYLKHNVAEITQPFFLLIPPMVNSLLGFAQNSVSSVGSNPSTRQLVLPLATDPNLTVLQISRIKSNFTNTLSSTCSSSSPLCAGVIFSSMTFYRI